MLMKIVRQVSIPVLLVASMFSRSTGSYERLVDLLICLGAIILIHRSLWLQEYFWGAGFAAIAVVFSPLALAVKIFLLMGVTSMAAGVTLLAAFRTQPLPAGHP